MVQGNRWSKSPRTYRNFYLFVIVIVALLARVLFLAEYPKGFSCDEASFGYEAFSILETGRDRYGAFLPPFLKLFGNDYPASLYVFLTVPFIKFLGVNEFSTRIVAALAGTLTVILVYWLARELFDQRAGFIAALLLAISPWHIHYSRISFNLIFLPLFFCVALLFFVRSFRKPTYLPWSGLFFGISLYTYSSARVFVSLFVLGLIVIFWKHFWNHKKQTCIATVLFLLIFIPLFHFWVSPAGMARVRGTGLQTNFTVLYNYLSHFSPQFLFWQGGSVINENPAEIGELYFFELATVLVGIVALFQAKTNAKPLLFLWLVLYPLPAALVYLASPQRSIIGAPLFAILSAYGVVQLIDRVRLKERVVVTVGSFVVTASLVFFTHHYFVAYSSHAARLWDYGIGKAIHFAETSPYNSVVMNSDKNSSCFAIYNFVGFVPFYTKYSPEDYQQNPVPPWIKGSRSRTYSLGKYKLMALSRQQTLDERSLYILRPDELSTLSEKGYQWKEVHSIKDTNVEYLKLVEITKARELSQ